MLKLEQLSDLTGEKNLWKVLLTVDHSKRVKKKNVFCLSRSRVLN